MASDESDTWHAASRRAEELIAIKRYEEAIPLLQTAITQNPQESSLFCKLSQAWLGLNKFDNALLAAEGALRAEPTSEWGHRLRSVSLNHLARKSEALAAALEAVKAAPEEPLTLLNLANRLVDNDLITQAEMVARKMRKLDPDNAAMHNLFGRIALTDEDGASARKHFEKSLAINPAEAAYHRNLGLTHLKGWNLSQAESRYREALRMNPLDHALQTEWKRARGRRRMMRSLPLLGFLGLAFLIFYWVITSREDKTAAQGLAQTKQRRHNGSVQGATHAGD